MTTISVPGTTARCRRPTPAVSSAGGKRVDSAVPERRVRTRTSGAPRAVVSPRRRTRRSLTGARALPPFVDEIPAFLANPSPGLAPAAAANTVVFTGGIKVLLKGLTWPGVINSWFLGTTVMAAFGVGGYVLVCLYFVFGSAVTKIKLEQKQAEGIAEARGGRRGVGSVWGSGIAGIACACLALAGVGPGENLWRLGFVASFCSKLSDTTASEVGKAYGKTTYMSTPPFRSVPRGTEGAVSLEGTVAGIGASLGFAGVAAAAGQVDLTGALIATLAAFIATTAESWLGATTQGEAGFEWLTNDVVNAVQITLAAAVAVALGAAVGCG